MFSLLAFRLFLAKSWFRARHRLAARESCAESGREMAHLKEYLDHLDRLHGAVYSVSGERHNCHGREQKICSFEICSNRCQNCIVNVIVESDIPTANCLNAQSIIMLYLFIAEFFCDINSI